MPCFPLPQEFMIYNTVCGTFARLLHVVYAKVFCAPG